MINYSLLALAVLALVLLTNVIVNVLKHVYEVKKVQPMVVVTAIVLTIIVGAAFGLYFKFNTWYAWAGDVVASIILGFVIAYISMWGYDKGYSDILTVITEFIAVFQNLIDYILGHGGK